MHSSFSALPAPWSDPLFSIAALAKEAGPTAIDGTVGIVLSEDGLPHVLSVTRQAALDLSVRFSSRHFSYPPLLGVPGFRASVLQLIDANHAASIATTGGTAALAICLRTARVLLGSEMTVIVPTPTWINHHNICHGAGLRTTDVPCIKNGAFDASAVLAALDVSDQPRTLLIQSGCHNPTGLDQSETTWRDIATLCARHSIIVVLDLAYQGFSAAPDADLMPLRTLLAHDVTTLVAWSASKNHSLYGLRTGLAAALTKTDDERAKAEGQFMQHARTFTSAAPTVGQEIVERVQTIYKKEWESELGELRELLQKKRQLIAAAFPHVIGIGDGHGMFAMLPLDADQIRVLREEHRVFLAPDGRINIAGIPLARMDELLSALHKVSA